MANKPHAKTVTVSFTLPRSLDEAVEREARISLGNKSDIIRKALLEWLSPEDRQAVLKEIAVDYKIETKK